MKISNVGSMGVISTINTTPSTNPNSSSNTQSAQVKSQPAADVELDNTKVVQESGDVPRAKSFEKSEQVAEDGKPDPEKEKELMDKSIEQANNSLKIYDRVIERTVHKVTGTIIYTIKDTKTNEVIAEYPPRKIQDMIAKMWELAGLVVDKKV